MGFCQNEFILKEMCFKTHKDWFSAWKSLLQGIIVDVKHKLMNFEEKNWKKYFSNQNTAKTPWFDHFQKNSRVICHLNAWTLFQKSLAN